MIVLGAVDFIAGDSSWMLRGVIGLLLMLVLSYIFRVAVFRCFVGVVVRIFYRFRVQGLENVPKTGGALLICNHVSYVDAVILSALSPRPIRFLSHESLHRVPILGGILRLAGTIPVSEGKSKDAIRKAVESLKKGDLVGIFPEGHLTRDGSIDGFKKGFSIIAKMAKAPIIPVCLDGLWGSIFSFYGHRYFWKIPRKLPYDVGLNFDKPMTVDSLTAETARQKIVDLGEASFQERPILKKHLGAVVLEVVAKRPNDVVVIDCTSGKREMKGGMLLALSLSLAQKIKKEIPEKRVGIVLPPGIGATIANLACVFADKIPVNLNFTLGPAAVQKCIDRAGVKTTITAKQAQEKIDSKMPGFPWTSSLWDIREELLALSKPKTIAYLAAIYVLPSSSLAGLWGIPKMGDQEEAALLFTSGSDGDPKGVVLTHRNIIGNAIQVRDCGALTEFETLLANLPIFHSFGFTVSLWCALISRIKTVTLPSPLEFQRVAKVVEQEKVSIMLATPTFLRPYLNRVEPEKLASLRIVIVGAEKTPKGFREAWEAKFTNSKYLEGYGLTETSPVVAVNVPNTGEGSSKPVTQEGTRSGSVGRMLNGIAARIQNPDTGELQSTGETGILLLKGVNIFPGYLDDAERTADVFRDEWFITGDLARFDEDGFLYIEGRLSRFSKMGGEMVPHGTVETTIAKAFELDQSDVPQLAVSARPDEAKGEVLVLLTTFDLEASELRSKLADSDLPNLWIPKVIKKVEAIPVLGSGKLDIKAIKKIAEAS